jgi:DNA-binding response OmpR family regulator
MMMARYGLRIIILIEKKQQLPFTLLSQQTTTKCKGGHRAIINKRVLIVDDEPDLNLMFKIILEDNGFKVDSFSDPLLALENFKGKAGMYDMIILDIKMPKMDGFELYRKIRKIDDKVKVCFTTAGEMDYNQFRKELFPALDNKCYIQKPIETEMLIKRLNRILSESNDDNNTKHRNRNYNSQPDKQET